jgi:hypothetical protein
MSNPPIQIGKDSTNQVRPPFNPSNGPPMFPFAPHQSTRCFFTQPLHGLIDSSTLFSTGFTNANNLVLGQKMESTSIFSSKMVEPETALNTGTSSSKRKLEVLLRELHAENVDPETEDV